MLAQAAVVGTGSRCGFLSTQVESRVAVDGCLGLAVVGGGTAPGVGAATATATAAGESMAAGDRRIAAARSRTRAVFVVADDAAVDVDVGAVGGVDVGRSGAFAVGQQAKNVAVVAEEDSSEESFGGAAESLSVAAASASWRCSQGCQNSRRLEVRPALAHPRKMKRGQDSWVHRRLLRCRLRLTCF